MKITERKGRETLAAPTLACFKSLSESSGIYLLSYKGKIIYIGQTANLKKRIGSHYKADVEKCAKGYATKLEKGLCFRSTTELAKNAFFSYYKDEINVSFLPCPIEKLNSYEQQMISIAQPIFNYAGVDAPYIPYER